MSKARPILALIAAYALALQVLLLPLSVMAAPFAHGLCAAAQSNNTAPGHTTGCPCAAGCALHCCGGAFAGSAAAGVAFIAATSEVTAPEPLFIATHRAVGRSPQVPRAPPAA